MCGICGIAYKDVDRPVEPSKLVRMRAAIAHRGPDGTGEHCAMGVGFAHARLSIIDVAGGSQPLSNEDGTVWVTFNGEIYNFGELRARLIRLGHRFSTRSDTEVLVHAYEEYGPEVATQLNGMFAFAIHDIPRRRVLLVRDHLGVKPLFYRVDDQALYFGSEIKAILAVLDAPPALRRESLQEYLIFRYLAGSRTMFEGIHRLPAGHLAVWESGELRIRQYWTPAAEPPGKPMKLDDAVAQLDEHLTRAVGLQMMSEVPLGAFCSGGMDSGLVTGYAARSGPYQLHTFSVGFDDPAWDETSLAQDTARRFDTAHHTVVAKVGEFEALLDDLVRFNDEPLSHPNSVPLYILSKFARERVTVVLTGEGSDELFGGYPRYHVARLRAALDPLSEPICRLLARPLRASADHRLGRVADALSRPLEDAFLFNSAYANPEVVSALSGLPVDAAVEERRELLRRAVVPGDPLATISRYELATYLGCALERMDRMSMACGLEARVPFLDVALVEWGLRLSSHLKQSALQTKRTVRRLAGRSLSRAITRGRKSGFGVPLADWFRSPSFASRVARLQELNHPLSAFFDARVLGAAVDQHLARSADHGELLWQLLNVHLWHDQHFGGATRERTADSLGRTARQGVA